VQTKTQTASDGIFLFISGRLCLDFVNTEIMKDGQRTDLTPDWDAMKAWFTEAGLMEDTSRKEQEEAAVETALSLRTALRVMAQALSGGETVPQASLDTVNAVLAQNRGTRQVVRDEQTGSFQERFINDSSGIAALLAPIAQDTVDLLCNGEHTYVRQCENPQCILFFYDTTKNHGRRWCRMNACGNRAKAAAHYQRRKQQK
jgi:predicted RNA-binding Zn ribbon-like protein